MVNHVGEFRPLAIFPEPLRIKLEIRHIPFVLNNIPPVQFPRHNHTITFFSLSRLHLSCRYHAMDYITTYYPPNVLSRKINLIRPFNVEPL